MLTNPHAPELGGSHDPWLLRRQPRSSPRRTAPPGLLFILLGLALAPVPAPASPPAPDVQAAGRVLQRLLPQYVCQFELRAIEPARSGGERFRLSRSGDRISIEGSTTSALLMGTNWYLKYIAHLQVSPNGDQLGDGRPLPLPDATAVEMSTVYPWRYALNENVDGYTTPYWDWPRPPQRSTGSHSARAGIGTRIPTPMNRTAMPGSSPRALPRSSHYRLVTRLADSGSLPTIRVSSMIARRIRSRRTISSGTARYARRADPRSSGRARSRDATRQDARSLSG